MMTEQDQLDMAICWHVYLKQNPNLKGYEKTKAEFVFARSYGIIKSYRKHKRTAWINRLKFWKK